MKSNVPLQAYVPGNIAAWVEGQARKAAVSRSQWLGTVLADLYEGRVRDEALRKGQATPPCASGCTRLSAARWLPWTWSRANDPPDFQSRTHRR